MEPPGHRRRSDCRWPQPAEPFALTAPVPGRAPPPAHHGGTVLPAVWTALGAAHSDGGLARGPSRRHSRHCATCADRQRARSKLRAGDCRGLALHVAARAALAAMVRIRTAGRRTPVPRVRDGRGQGRVRSADRLKERAQKIEPRLNTFQWRVSAVLVRRDRTGRLRPGRGPGSRGSARTLPLPRRLSGGSNANHSRQHRSCWFDGHPRRVRTGAHSSGARPGGRSRCRLAGSK